MKLACLGDSITYGYLCPRRANWVALLAERAGIETLNFGFCGDTTGGMLARFSRDVVDSRPDKVLILGGVNDFMMGDSVGSVKANLMAMVNQSYHYRMMPLLATPLAIDFPSLKDSWKALGDFTEVQQKLQELTDWLPGFCEIMNVPLIRFREEFAEAVREDPSSFYIDGIHPNKKGQVILAGTAAHCPAILPTI